MLRPIKELDGFSIHATDGLIGSVDKFYFDDARWTIRYIVVDTGNWLSGRKVLISPLAVIEVDWAAREFDLTLTKSQIENSPDIDMDRPVERQREIDYFNYYGWPYYGYGDGLGGTGAYATALTAAASFGAERVMETPPQKSYGDPHLRSTGEVIGYNFEAADGELGHVDNFIVDDESWAIR